MSSVYRQQLELDLEHSPHHKPSQLQKMVCITFIVLLQSNVKSFVYLSAVPTEPLNLTVSYINATALDIAWREPLCDYGIRTNYTV